jgi:hypothetical protein
MWPLLTYDKTVGHAFLGHFLSPPSTSPALRRAVRPIRISIILPHLFSTWVKGVRLRRYLWLPADALFSFDTAIRRLLLMCQVLATVHRGLRARAWKWQSIRMPTNDLERYPPITPGIEHRPS